MAVQNAIQYSQTATLHMSTTNKSFLDMHFYLKTVGIQNNAFFLILYNQNLLGIDPRDPMLTTQQKLAVLAECRVNYWYFLREVVRIPIQGGATKGGARYKLHRGNLAMNFLSILNFNSYLEWPRQHFKTVSVACRLLYLYICGTSNSEMMLMHKDLAGSKNNLKVIKELRDALPSYMQMSSGVDKYTGKKLKVPNTVVQIQHPVNNNKILTSASARSEDAADKMGRGLTIPDIFMDEFAFMPYNQTVYTAAIPAYSRASQNAKNMGAPYGIIIATTPGDLTTEEGKYAFKMRNDATPWNDRYYDLNFSQLQELHDANTYSSFFLVSFTYQQLGSGEDYFKEMVVNMNRDWPKIRREVLLEWAQMANNCPFTQEDLDKIRDWCREPIRTLFFGKAQQYQFLIYEDIDLRYPPIMGVDVGGALRQDSSAITIVDSKTTRVTATFNCNYIPSDDLADLIYTIVTSKMSNAIVNIERTGVAKANLSM